MYEYLYRLDSACDYKEGVSSAVLVKIMSSYTVARRHDRSDGGKTRLKLRKDTELKNFLLFCPKCKQETLVNVKEFINS